MCNGLVVTVKGENMVEIYDYLFLGTIAIAIIVVLLLFIVAGRRKPFYGDPQNSEKYMGHEFVIKKRNVLLRSSIIWQTIYYWTALTAILATIYVIYITNFTSSEYIALKVFLYSCFSLFASITLLVVDPKKKADKYRESFMILDSHINRFELCDKAKMDMGCENCTYSNNYCSIKALDECEENLYGAHK